MKNSFTLSRIAKWHFRYRLYCIFLIMIISTICVETLTSEPINGPCPGGPYLWSDAKTIEICYYCPEHCCYKVQYYDRFRYESDTSFNYDVSIANIYFPSGTPCKNCKSKMDLATDAYRQIIEKNRTRQSFIDSVNWTDGQTNIELLYTPMMCKKSLTGEQCSQEILCCETPIYNQINNGNYSAFPINFFDDRGFCQSNSDTNCHQFCFGFNPELTYEYYSPCPIPCNSGVWSANQYHTIEVFDCQPQPSNCRIFLTYQTRTTSGCNPNYFDYRIVDFFMQDCNNCTNLVEQDYYGKVVSWLLYYGGQALPPEGDCIDNYRIASSLCWKFKDTVDTSGHFIKQAEYCSDTVCCIKYYKICSEWNDLLNKFTYRWYDLTPVEELPECINNCIRLCSPIPE